MGLKTTNYKIEGNIYPTVYAVFANKILPVANGIEVWFNIQTSRDLALHNKPLTIIKVLVTNWDRKTDLVCLAYNIGKEKQWRYIGDGVYHQYERVEVDGPFTGWDDDIL